ncbi:hypothetical protein [Vannielia sp.]|uniref:hypothetical protein n=1 Tax=Vannielia sp. TaxID=2813045 RepID=UPI002612047B|nr:hypothetical protein [Vannielia sp.]MDF1872555.1 hypothetical protein [Vannielia sp.]
MKFWAMGAVHLAVIAVLTALTLVGGLAWFLALGLKRRLLAFILIYAGLTASAFVAAPLVGREAVPCWGGPLRAKMIYCAMNRSYVTPELAEVLEDLAVAMEESYPGTVTLMLDGGFPFTTLPLLPRLNHDDGEKANQARCAPSASALT